LKDTESSKCLYSHQRSKDLKKKHETRLARSKNSQQSEKEEEEAIVETITS